MNRNKLDQSLLEFTRYTREKRYLSDIKERENRISFFKLLATKKFDETVLSEIIKKLWASQIFSNKEYLVEQIIKSNGLDKLSLAFRLLNNNKIKPEKRYSYFMENIKGMGPSMVTEYLCYIDSGNSGVWNNVARLALSWLEAKEVAYNKYKISEQEYQAFNSFSKGLASEIKERGIKKVDLLLVDYFLWEVWNNHAKGKIVEPKKQQLQLISSKSRHDELRDKVFQIGSWLGFDPEIEKPISSGAKVDVLWRTKIANLGSISYVFEVQDRGSVDSLLLNLQKAQKSSTVQKLIVVTDSKQIDKIAGEVEDLPESFRRVITFWEDLDVDKTHENLEQVSASISKLTLVES